MVGRQGKHIDYVDGERIGGVVGLGGFKKRMWAKQVAMFEDCWLHWMLAWVPGGNIYTVDKLITVGGDERWIGWGGAEGAA